jgi:hypothetical protein
LQPEHLKNGKINLFNTKSGKNRYIPINEELNDSLRFPLDEMDSRSFAKCFEKAKIKKNGRAEYTHFATYVCQSFYYEWWRYFDFTADIGS